MDHWTTGMDYWNTEMDYWNILVTSINDNRTHAYMDRLLEFIIILYYIHSFF